jgi:hypothetical protein
MDQIAVQLLRAGFAERRSQQDAGLEGRVLRVGQVQQGELGAGTLAEPTLQEGRDRRGRRGPGLDGCFVFREGEDRGVGAGVRRANGHKKAGSFKAESCAAGVGGGHARYFLIQTARFGHSQRSRIAVDEGHRGRVAVRKLYGEAQPEMRAGQSEFVLADLVEEACAVAQDYGDAGDRVPDHVAKAAQTGERDADPVPVRVQRHIVRSSDDQEALGGCGDGAGVVDVELKVGSRRQRLA